MIRRKTNRTTKHLGVVTRHRQFVVSKQPPTEFRTTIITSESLLSRRQIHEQVRELQQVGPRINLLAIDLPNVALDLLLIHQQHERHIPRIGTIKHRHQRPCAHQVSIVRILHDSNGRADLPSCHQFASPMPLHLGADVSRRVLHVGFFAQPEELSVSLLKTGRALPTASRNRSISNFRPSYAPIPQPAPVNLPTNLCSFCLRSAVTVPTFP